jgi:molybdopterin-containing oxidoreductase family iron-sulfur binding subunit
MKFTRRNFLKLTALGGMTIAGEHAISKAGRLVPYVIPPERLAPVEWHTIAPTCRECPAGCGMHIWHRDGRITKAEGNPVNPINHGGLCARGQSALQGVYDPDRIKHVLFRKRGGPFKKSTFENALTEIVPHLKNARGRVSILSRLETGTLAEIMTEFLKAFSSDRLIFAEAFHYGPIRKANAALFGREVIPKYRLDRCNYILSFGADFLETWISNVEFANQFSAMHSLRNGKIGYFTYIGPRRSMTACNADDFLQIPLLDQSIAALALLKIMQEQNYFRQGSNLVSSLVGNLNLNAMHSRVPVDRLRKIATDFMRAEDSVALACPTAGGGHGVEGLAFVAAILNAAADKHGDVIDLTRPHALSRTADDAAINRFLDEITERDVLIIHQTNPVYHRPGSERAILRAGLVIYCGTMLNETAAISDWVIPETSDLESWGDYEPYPGIYNLMQPTMRPQPGSLEAGDIFLNMASAAGKPLRRERNEPEIKTTYDWVRNRFERLHKNREWEESLQHGGIWKEEEANHSRQLHGSLRDGDLPGILERSQKPESLSENQAELWLWPSVMLFDGRVSNRGWLQENPEPASTVVWGSWIDIHPDKAKRLGIAHGDVIELSKGERRIQAPARLTDDVFPDTVSLALGQGHTALGKIASGLGANGFLLFPSLRNSPKDRSEDFFGRVVIRKTGRKEDIITAMTQRDQHGRDLLRWKTLNEIKLRNPGLIRLPLKEGYSDRVDLYPPHEHRGHRWAMVVDLQRCIGCQACAVACYAENNLFVVGRKQMKWSRNMPWLRIVPYRHPEKKERIAWLPMLCQHCDSAPCEPVCPVFAAVNNEEGLNAQIYNRCIGTRYCSNNCPYKVRRFNFLNTHWEPPLDRQLNPEVTVRCRGVMEKCTFCVQRIRNAEYRAVRENRPVRDGEIQPACAQSCPAKVYTFGDLLDPESKVSRIIHHDPRRYQVLQELNTKPAVIYLYKIEQD